MKVGHVLDNNASIQTLVLEEVWENKEVGPKMNLTPLKNYLEYAQRTDGIRIQHTILLIFYCSLKA